MSLLFFSIIYQMHILHLITIGLTCENVKDVYRTQGCCGQDHADFELPEAWRENKLDQCYLKYTEDELGKDALDMVIVGSRSPAGFNGQAQSCTAIIAGDHWFMVDMGDGCARRINYLEFPWLKFSGILFTHFHSDHIDDLGTFRMIYYTSIASDPSSMPPFTVFGPKNLSVVVEGNMKMFSLDTQNRFEHHNTSLGQYPQLQDVIIKEFDLPDEAGALVQIFNENNLSVSAFEVDHVTMKPAIGYRFDFMGRSIVIGGDTIYQPFYIPAIFKADVLVADLLDAAWILQVTDRMRNFYPFRADIGDDIVDFHSDVEQYVRQIIEADIKLGVMSHFVHFYLSSSEDVLKNRIMDRVELLSARVANRSIFAEEGRRISLPINSDEIILTEGATPWARECDVVDLSGLRSVFKPLLSEYPKSDFTFDQIPRAQTPLPGGWTSFPDPILNTDVPPVPWAPDLRGVWKTIAERMPNGTIIPFQTQIKVRIEQADLRIIFTGGGIIHDLVADGSEENAVKDVLESDLKTEMVVKGEYHLTEYEDKSYKAHNLYPISPFSLNTPVTRWIDEYNGKEHLFWKYPTSISKVLGGETLEDSDYVVRIQERVANQNVQGSYVDRL